MIVRARIVIACAVAGLGFAPAAFAGFVVFSVGGDDTIASIQTTVDDFRAALGDPLNGNAAGPLPDGRREINWDGGGATTASPVGTPFAGFQNTRGALFTTAGTGFLQTPLDAPELFAINPTYGTTFGFFSQLRIFTPIASNVVDVTFFIPGSGGLIPATVGGFGAVFTDVDLAGTSRIEFFDVNNNVLFTDTVDPGSVADGSLSFLGAVANAGEDIFRVRLIAGTTALGPNDNPTGGTDVAAFDDYLYAEPQRAVSEPSVLLLLGSALCALVGWGWIRRRRRTPRSR